MTTTTPSSDLSSFLGADPGVARLYDNVQATVPAVLLSLIKMETWNIVMDFYTQSGFQRAEVYWQMAAGVQSVNFNPFDADHTVAWVLAVSGLTSFRIEPPAMLIDMSTSFDAQRNGSALLALRPTAFTDVSTGCCTGSELWTTWFDVILDGVLWRLYRSPAKPYTSPQLAEYHGRRYRSGVARARSFAQSGNGPGGGRWQFPYFAGGRRKN